MSRTCTRMLFHLCEYFLLTSYIEIIPCRVQQAGTFVLHKIDTIQYIGLGLCDMLKMSSILDLFASLMINGLFLVQIRGLGWSRHKYLGHDLRV